MPGATSADILTSIANRSLPSSKQILLSVLEKVGGVEGIAEKIASDYQAAADGSAGRIRLDAMLMEAMDAQAPDVEDETFEDDDPEEQLAILAAAIRGLSPPERQRLEELVSVDG